jgi:transporter family protein
MGESEEPYMNYIFLALISMVFMGLVDFLLKKAIAAGVHIYAISFFVYLLMAIFFGTYCLLKKVPLKINKSLVKYSILAGLFIFIGTFLALFALKAGNASVIVPIVRMGFVVTAICAVLFLKEKITLEKGLGILFAVAALVLLSH